jgi:YidC/Oxa1 family membrane protein insertase
MFEVLATVLAFFYQVTKSYGFAIILLTVAVRLVLFPLTAKQMRSMQGMSRIQPELKRLQAEHKDDRMKLQEEMTALYRREGINPVGGCLPLVLQIPVFIGLFNVIRGLSSSGRLASLQVDVPKPQYLSPNSPMYRSIVNGGGRLLSFGFDLAQSASGVTGGIGTRFPYVFLIVVYVVSAYAQQHLANKRNPAAAGQAAQVQQLMKIFPLFLGVFYYSMPAGLVLYFVASNLWTIAQQEVLARAMPPVKADPAPAAVIEATASPLGEPTRASLHPGKKSQTVTPQKVEAERTKPNPKAPAKPGPVVPAAKAARPTRQGTATPRPAPTSEKNDGTTAKGKRKAR